LAGGSLGSGKAWLKVVRFEMTSESKNWLMGFTNIGRPWIPNTWSRDAESARSERQVMPWHYKLVRTRWAQRPGYQVPNYANNTAQGILFLSCQRSCWSSNGITPSGVAKFITDGISYNRRFLTNVLLCRTDGARQRHSYNGRIEGTRMSYIEWCYFQWLE